MIPRVLFRRSLPALLVLALACAAPSRAQTTDSDTPDNTPANGDGPLGNTHDVAKAHLIDNDTIIRMHKAGIGDDVLIQTVQIQPGHYDTNPDDLISLKTAGLSDRVIAAMQAHAAGLGTHVLPTNDTGVRSPSSLPQGVDEIGVYYKSKTGEWIELRAERLVLKSGGAAKSILTHGIISKDMNGHVDGAHSSLVLPTGVQILIYAPPGTQAEEYDFLRFRQHSDNREFRVQTGGVFHSETGADRDEVEFKPSKIGPQLYTFTVPADIIKGEYGVLPPGSSNHQGVIGGGKIFTFSIPE